MSIYDDHVQPFHRGVVAKIKDYDPRLFIRWNKRDACWELWRWRDNVVIPEHPTRLDIDQKAACQYQVSVEGMDHRFPRTLILTDLYARFNPSGDPAKIADAMDRADRVNDEKVERDVEQTCLDWAHEDRKFIDRDLRNVYAGYYPPKGSA